jgi:molecular chaperone DnaK (HSP70)
MARFVVGIDLGTTNTVVAYAEKSAGEGSPIELFEIEQLVAPGEIAKRPMLPSLRYHPAAGELKAQDIGLPWARQDIGQIEDVVIGSLARELGSQVPGRLVSSAKSWLSHPTADRTAPILPWGAPEDVPVISPLAASASYLQYIRSAWNTAFPGDPLEAQDLVLTVPASFDEAARGLTVEAARMAKIGALRLIEEPQAAFYDWMYRHQGNMGDRLRNSHLALVCDMGGGTTDLTLISIEFRDDEPRFKRVGVGDHLMLGGDNMDLGLAHLVEARIAATGSRLSGARLSQLIQQCRTAKERLLAADAPERTKVTVLGAGAKLIGGAQSVELERAEVHEMVVDGFFPTVEAQERPQRARGGIVEFGLPYASDPAVTRHLAAFLELHGDSSRAALAEARSPPGSLAVPDTLLLNGGVFNAGPLTDRLVEVLEHWRGAPINVLANENPDAAVARGAVAYGLARLGKAPKIAAGSARSYALVVEDGEESQRGVCLLPRDTEVGRKVQLEGRTFALRVGQPVRFHLVSSTADTAYEPGALLDIKDRAFRHLPPIAAVIPEHETGGEREVPVQIRTELTDVGTLEIYCISVSQPNRKWKLEFQLRGEAARGETPDSISAELPARFTDAAAAIQRMYGGSSHAVGPKEIKQLRSNLEKMLGPRDGWDTPLLRELYGVLWDGGRRRRRSVDHERVWLSLAGFFLRPGFGYPLDDWRVHNLWTIFEQGIQYGKASQNWSEWWTLWRRAAGGLGEEEQTRILDDIEFYLQPAGKGARKRAPGARKQGYDDMVRLAASLERVSVERKLEVGRWLLERLDRPTENAQTWWAVGRIGTRVPFHGSAHNVIPADEATAWLRQLLQTDWKKSKPTAFAAVMLARMSGDRERDLEPAIRDKVIEKLAAIRAPASWSALIREPSELNVADQKLLIGDSLPAGLKLID